MVTVAIVADVATGEPNRIDGEIFVPNLPVPKRKCRKEIKLLPHLIQRLLEARPL